MYSVTLVFYKYHVVATLIFLSFSVDIRYGFCEQKYKVQFRGRFIEWLAITKAEEEAKNNKTFDVTIFTRDFRRSNKLDESTSELLTVS